jgi:phosphodiesterase/alkaline phosphatase D-like protein
VRSHSKAPTTGSAKRRIMSFDSCLLTSLLVVLLFAAPASANPPEIGETWAEDVVQTEATLKAKVNPEGLDTTLKFEWGTTTSYGDASPESGVGSDSAEHLLSAFLDELQPATTYHYRVLATNADGTSQGPDRTITTYAPPSSETDCPNQPFRIGPAAHLPDCRAYEMVSPIFKNG